MKRRLWFRVRRRGPEPVQVVADECVAYLEGRSADRLRDRREPVPAWACVNQLAHGSLDRLRSLAAGCGAPSRRRSQASSWDGVVALLATQLVADADDDAALRALQRSALWPLEAELFAVRDQVSISPNELFVLALGCIVDAAARPS
jgi:hypothetical protein